MLLKEEIQKILDEKQLNKNREENKNEDDQLNENLEKNKDLPQFLSSEACLCNADFLNMIYQSQKEERNENVDADNEYEYEYEYEDDIKRPKKVEISIQTDPIVEAPPLENSENPLKEMCVQTDEIILPYDDSFDEEDI